MPEIPPAEAIPAPRPSSHTREVDTLTRRVVSLAVALAVTGLAGCSDPARPKPPAADNASAPPESTAVAPASIDSVVAAVEDRVAVYDGIATGVIVLVRVGDRTEVVTGGRANVRDDLATGPHQTFPIASITKPMTATVIMQLVAEGLLKLDDPVQEWLPELRAIRTPITVEHLLSHRSGLPDSSNAEIRRIGFDTSALLEASAGHGLDFTPGTEGTYSNLGFAALGLVVERVLDQPLAEVLEQRVFGTAGMSSSSLFGRPDVQGYADNKPVKDYFLRLQPAAGSVVSTVGDVHSFFRALWDGELVGPRKVADMRKSRGQVRIGPFWRPDYGLGLIHDKVGCGVAIGHSGRIGGFTNEAWTLEGGDRSTVVMVNDEAADDIARSIAQIALCS